MTLINGYSNSSTDSYETKSEFTIEEVVLPKEKDENFISTFALTHVGNYSVFTIRKSDDWYETKILCDSHEDNQHIGYYCKKSISAKTALDQHVEAIWHVHHSCREGL